MTHTHDFWEALRGWFVPKLGRTIAWLNSCTNLDLYVEGTTTWDQFVGVVDMPEEDLEEVLCELGFERNPLSAWKRLTHTSRYEEGSWRKTHGDFDEYVGLVLPKMASLYDHDGHDDFQTHVVLYEIDDDYGTTAVFAHFELAWDAHPIGHYRSHYFNPQFGVDYVRTALRVHFGEEYDGLVSHDTPEWQAYIEDVGLRQ